MEENITAVAEEPVVLEDSAVVSEEVLPPKKKRKPINQAKLQDNLWGWIFCIPLIVGTVWFVYSALIMALMLSFTNFSLGGQNSQTLMEFLGNYANNLYKNTVDIYDPNTGAWVGSETISDAFYWYKQIFTNKGFINEDAGIMMNQMGAYLFNTVFYMIGIPIGMFLAMFFAVCMSRDIKGGNVFRVLYYIPCVASTISIVYTFRTMFNVNGVINHLFGGSTEWLSGNLTWNQAVYGNNTAKWSSSAFMSSPYWCQGIVSKCVVIIMSVWKGLGGTIILYVAGLSGVNAATKEAAQIDGANGWQIFWKVTMPDLYPVIFYNIVTSVIGGMQIYAEPVLMFTEATTSVSSIPVISNTSGYVSLIWIYGLNTGGGGASYPSAGAAYGMFLAVIIFVLTLFQFWMDGRKKD